MEDDICGVNTVGGLCGGSMVAVAVLLYEATTKPDEPNPLLTLVSA